MGSTTTVTVLLTLPGDWGMGVAVTADFRETENGVVSEGVVSHGFTKGMSPFTRGD